MQGLWEILSWIIWGVFVIDIYFKYKANRQLEDISSETLVRFTTVNTFLQNTQDTATLKVT